MNENYENSAVNELTPEQMFDKVIATVGELFNESGIDVTKSIQSLCGDGVVILGRCDIEDDENTDIDKEAFRILVDSSDREVLEYAKKLIEDELRFLDSDEE